VYAASPGNKPGTGWATQASAKTRRAESLGAVGVLRHPGDAEEPEASADLRIVYPGYFRAVGVALVKGRNFSAGDSEGAPRVVIVDEALAQRLWPRQEALGQRVRLVVGETENANGPWLTVIGVVKHQSGGPLEPTTHGQMYLPYPAAGERD
jgi:hypothetical protein